MVTIRRARPEEMEALQASWASIDFAPSGADDVILVALDDAGARVGQGRLVPMGDGHVELGGMWVRDAWRGRGVASALVRSLLDAAGGAVVWCVPWADLAAYYQGLGIPDVAPEETAPEGVRAKLAYCRARYARAVTLLRRG